MCDRKKYYVIKTTKDGVLYKRYKCIDGWTRNKEICWQFSKQGAEKIAKRLNSFIPEQQKYKVHYNTLEVD